VGQSALQSYFQDVPCSNLCPVVTILNEVYGINKTSHITITNNYISRHITNTSSLFQNNT